MMDAETKLATANRAYRSTIITAEREKAKLEARYRALIRKYNEIQEELEYYKAMHAAVPLLERRQLERKFRKR